MTTSRAAMSPRPLPRRRRGMFSALLRAVGSLVMLALLMVALPAGLLYGTVTLAGSNLLPVHESIPTMLTSPDQGGLFAWALVAVGWTAWGCFAVSVLVEVPAQLRGRMPRRLPAMGWSQRTAAGLIGAVFALLPTTGAFAATTVPATGSPTVAAAPVQTSPVSSSSPQASSTTQPASAIQHNVYTVSASRPAESLWSIAEQQLGSGERWKDIARLNQGRTMDAEGRVFQADGTIQPGWKLIMPADTKSVAAHAAHAAHAAGTTREELVTVRPGDSLSEIAVEHRVPGGWPALYRVNRDLIGVNPDLIRPGEQLALPAGSSATSTPTPVTPPVSTPPVKSTPPAKTPPAKTPPAKTPPKESAPAAAPTATAEPTAGASAPTGGLPTPAPTVHAGAGAGVQDSGDSGGGDSILLPALGAGAILAAGLLGVIGRNRVLQQRRRPPRRRIPMPSMEEEQYETFLRGVADPSGLDLLDRTLRTLAMTCLTHGGELPALAAVALRPGGTIDLYLIEPSQAPAPAPFTASPNGRMWRCKTGEAELLSAAQAADVPAPYPALVTLGRTPENVQVLADLETVRHLHLDGTAEEVAAVTRALVAELAASTIADHLRLIVLGSAAPLVGNLGVDRLRTREQPEEALADLVAHRTALDQALVDCQVAHPRAARSQGVAIDTWVSVLLCTDQVMTQDQLDELGWVLAGREHRCIAAVTPATPGAGWHLDARPGHYRIAPNLPFAVELQRMTETEFEAAVGILAISQQESVPAPAWTEHDPDDGGPEVSEEDPFYIPVLAAHARATAGADPTSVTAVPLIGDDTPGAPSPQHLGPRHQHPSHQPATYQGPPPSAPVPPPLPPLPVPGPSGPAAPPPPPVRRVDPRVMPLTALTQGYDVVATPPDPGTGPAAGPRVLLLGQVRVIATNGTADPSRISQLTALAALLTLRPDPDPRDVDAVLAPSPFYVSLPGNASAQGSLRSRASALSKLRDWLGQAPDGTSCLPPAAWRLHPAVTSDWADFQELYRQGMNQRSAAADAALRRALDLVRGRPFDAAYGLYPWAEPYRQDMISAIIDASHELAKRRLGSGDYSGCEAALHSGLAAVPEAEILHRGLMVLYATTGQRDHLTASINLLAQVNASLGCDFSPETLSLIRDLTSRPDDRMTG